MLEFFTNPGYLAAAGALISAPIIIHLINRMRFKRIAWAAMEFLLKAQKKMRKRLIIEQLILLALRCFLVALVGLLVMRFVGFAGETPGKQAMHIVVLDDTLSMTDEWKEGDGARNCFTVAKNDVLLGKIVKTLGQTAATDRLMLIPLSRFLTEKGYSPKVYEKLNDGAKFKEFKDDLDALPCSKLHVDMVQGVKKVREIINNNPEAAITLHILSDFRQRDWEVAKTEQSDGAAAESKDAEENLHSIIAKMTHDRKDLKVRLVDTVYPYRVAGQGGVPVAHENVGIVDLRAGTRIAGRDMPVPFTITLANFSSREVEVYIGIYDDATNIEFFEAAQNFNPPMPLKIPADKRDFTATFELRFNPQIKPGEPYYAQISARLESGQRGKLEGDAISGDNIRHAAVEIRDKVPILVIDGEGSRGRQENQDSFFLNTAIISVPGASYELVNGDELGGGVATKALERPDIRQYPSIFLLNVRELTDKQLANLEAYVKEGGGLGVFLGPQVNPAFYNKKFYNQGKGVFPAPLRETYFPPPNEDPLKLEFTGLPQLHIREKLFGNLDAVPIFGQVFKDTEQLKRLQDLPIKRYFQVPRSEWRQIPGKTFELATLPNRQPITSFAKATLDVFRGKQLEEVLKMDEFQRYRTAMDRHRLRIERLVSPSSEEQTGALAKALDDLLHDKGKGDGRDKDFPNLTEFWSNSLPKIAGLREDITRLAEQANYGDPFVVTSQYGKGRVVAVMSTAGKEWSDWGGGSDASLIFQPFIWEMQNYLSSQGSDANLTVGTPVEVVVDSEPYKQKGTTRLKMARIFYQIEPGKSAKAVKQSEQFGVEAPADGKGKNLVYFNFDKNNEPGLYVGLLKIDDGSERQPVVASYAQTFNVDTLKEGALGRISSEEIERGIIRAAATDSVLFEGPSIPSDSLVKRKSDFSESPWLYLIFIAVLIAEQALAVHLSFHLKGSETDALSRATAVKQAA
ncbi:MAG: BatA domain-containing protein [Planctomycetes bacterium]|nr:BatA domain-containing protein [Planctomycetota bacterium]